ncbi:MAG TPA: shikimate kinase [Erysipelotrichaceae bacterium]|nr:shikimate kinase [Erysipelotrichaceae bacterium]
MYKLLGKNVSHSYSQEVHNSLGYDYKILDLSLSEFREIMEERSFVGVNITMPYKQEALKYLDYIDPAAKKLNVVNTVVHKDNKLYGYNTDYFGLKYLIKFNEIEIKDRNVVILGSGATSKTVKALCQDLGAKNITKVSQSNSNHLTYDDLSSVLNYQVLINTTPKEMYPNTEEKIIDLKQFNKLEAVVDVIYNPLKTNLILQAKDLNIKAVGGLEMLVGQAVESSSLFFNKKYPKDTINKVYKKLLLEKSNIVLVGMPTSGKSTIGKALAKSLNKKFIDVDKEIVKKAGNSIKEIFKEKGEAYFRTVESQVIESLSRESNLVIATGGGSVLDQKNVKRLKRNGYLIFIDRPLNLLIAADDRPLSANRINLKNLYQERYNIYKAVSDVTVINDKDLDFVLKKVLEAIRCAF